MGYSNNDLCGSCGERLGQHYYYTNECPIMGPQGRAIGFKRGTKFVFGGNATATSTVSPPAPTINTTPLPDNWYVTTDYRIMPNCGSCGAPAGEHHVDGAQCPNNRDPGKWVTGQFYYYPRGNGGLTDMPVPIPSTTHSTASKPLKQYKADEECPCGLMSAMCDYHRP
jgi:hypothetical protein